MSEFLNMCASAMRMAHTNNQVGADSEYFVTIRQLESLAKSVWHKAEGNPPPPIGDCRKIVWMRDPDGMEWWGVRAYNHSQGEWWINGVNGGRTESAVVLFWMDGPTSPFDFTESRGKGEARDSIQT